MNKLKQLYYALFIARGSGLKKLKKDVRDFTVGKIFGAEDYDPKSDMVVIETISVKDQGVRSTCGWESSIAHKECDEGVALSVRGNVAYAYRKGMCNYGGASNLRDNYKVLKDFGAMEQKDLAEGNSNATGNFNEYVNVSLDYTKAAIHKIQAYASVNTVNDAFKLLDSGRTFTFGMGWYSGFNQGGGFKLPWLIASIIGWLVGGHAVLCKGYIQNYITIKDKKLVTGPTGKLVFVVQNSYSRMWGATFIDNNGVEHAGCFFIDKKYMDSSVIRDHGGYGAYTSVDIPVSTLMNKYEGLNVKGTGPAIYKIENLMKKAYPNWETYLCHDGLDRGFTQLNKEEEAALNIMNKGVDMRIEDGYYYEYVKWVKNADDKNNSLANKLMEMIYKKRLGLKMDEPLTFVIDNK